jgi:hypothetical protein
MVHRQTELVDEPKPMQPGPDPSRSEGEKSTPDSTIDVDALAQRVYALLKREALIERERAGRRPFP